MDGRAELSPGAFSSDPGRSQARPGADLFLDPARVYASYPRDGEGRIAAMPGGASASTSSSSSRPTTSTSRSGAASSSSRGFNVVCDKPVTFSPRRGGGAEGNRRSGLAKVFVLTHNYTGNAMVKQARAW